MSQRIASHPKMRVDSDTGSLNFFSGYSFQVHHGNQRLQEILDTHTDPWGIKVALVELKGVDLPESMQRAMARQAEAEREKRAKVIHAQGEFEASQRLSEAAAVISAEVSRFRSQNTRIRIVRYVWGSDDGRTGLITKAAF